MNIVFGAAKHEHTPIKVNGNMTACAYCGVIILVPPPPSTTVELTGYKRTWPRLEGNQDERRLWRNQ